MRKFFTILFLIGIASVRGQSPVDGFDPNANNMVRIVVLQPDGKILIGGDFTMLSPSGGASITRNRIARLNPDGTVDSAFNPNASAPVYTIAVQADGKILVGGHFDSIGGQSRHRIARLDPITGLADSFDPNAGNDVSAIVIQTDGKILLGGSFDTVSSLGRRRIARVDPSTGAPDSFDPSGDNDVEKILLQADGKILVGGRFDNIGGQPRRRIARLDPGTGLADSFDPNAGNDVLAMALQADGRICVGGRFNTMGGQTRHRICRLDPVTGLPDSLDPNSSNDVYDLAVQTDGKILVAGHFDNVGGQSHSRLARVDPNTGQADAFNPSASNDVSTIALQPDGKILIGGTFNNIDSATRNRIARLEIDGKLDQTINPGIVGMSVSATAVQSDGKVLIGGAFSTVLSVPRNNMARLNTDGSLDLVFNPSPNSDVNCIVVQPDGKILVGGIFTQIGGQQRNFIGRLDPTTGAADSFDPGPNDEVNTIVIQSDGNILLGGHFDAVGTLGRNFIARLDPLTGFPDSFDPAANGDVLSIALEPNGNVLAAGFFTAIGGQGRNHIARLDGTTGMAAPFDPNANDDVLSIVRQPNGKILVGGSFDHVGGQTRRFIARLDAITGAADAFDPQANGIVHSIALQADGKILAGGDFSGSNSIGGQARNFIARVDGTTGLADGFDPNADDLVNSVALGADGKVIAGGFFNSIGGYARSLLVRLTNDTAALQNILIMSNFLAWTRGGASPQFSSVSFEYSNDNVNYALLGQGTATGGSWTLAGLTLPSGQDIYIRARGRYRSGEENGSGSSGELVENAFLGGVSPSPTATSSPSPTATSSPNPSPTPPHTPTPSLTATATATFTPTVTATPTATFVPTSTPTITATATATVTPFATATATAMVTLTPTPTPFCLSITQSSVQTIVPGHSVSCNDGTAHSDNSYWRAFDMGIFTGGRQFNVTAVSFGVESANVSQPVIVRLYTTTNFPAGFPNSLTQIGSVVVTVNSNQNRTVVSAPLVTTVPAATSQLVMELYTPDGRSSGHLFFVGSNGDSESVPSYISAPDCGVTTPAGVAAIGAPEMHLVFNVLGCIEPSPTPAPGTVKNISTRLKEGTGDHAMIAGFIVQGDAPKRVLVRSTGPSLANFGISEPLADPQLELHHGADIIATNDDWQRTIIGGVITGDQVEDIQNSGLSPTDPLESVIIGTLSPGSYSAVVRGANGGIGVATAEVYDLDQAGGSILANLSTRGFVETGDNVMIGGFIITDGPKRVIIRAIGPSLAEIGVPEALSDPQLELHDGTSLIARNDDWETTQLGGIITADQVEEIQDSQLAPSDSAESAIIATLPSGTYTAVVRGVNNMTGNALVEVYALQ